MLRAPLDKVDSRKEQMGNRSRKMEVQRKNQQEILEIKDSITEMKNAFEGLLSRLDMVEERLSVLEDKSIETSKTGKQGVP